MKVHLARFTEPGAPSNVELVEGQIRTQRHRRHELVEDPAAADLILFTECHFTADRDLGPIRRHPLARRFPHKVAVYDERDRPWCVLPGIYVSMPRRGFVGRWQVPGSYWHLESPRDRLASPFRAEPDYLYSFVGSPTHRCREPIFELSDRRACVERTDNFLFHDPSSERFAERRTRFAEVMLRSKFVLCPRGHGTSSFRLYEALSIGRVPVVLSDAWVPPAGPDWSQIAIRWPEARVHELPDHLTALEEQAGPMGERGLRAFEEWFAADVVVTRQLDELGALLGGAAVRPFPRGGYKNAQYRRLALGAARARARQLLPR